MEFVVAIQWLLVLLNLLVLLAVALSKLTDA
jgi:hypothetical protein